MFLGRISDNPSRDAANRLKNVNGGSLGSYGYDANGKRVKKSESGTTTCYAISSVLVSAMEVTSAESSAPTVNNLPLTADEPLRRVKHA
jgi:hypothetical protein